MLLWFLYIMANFPRLLETVNIHVKTLFINWNCLLRVGRVGGTSTFDPEVAGSNCNRTPLDFCMRKMYVRINTCLKKHSEAFLKYLKICVTFAVSIPRSGPSTILILFFWMTLIQWTCCLLAPAYQRLVCKVILYTIKVALT